MVYPKGRRSDQHKVWREFVDSKPEPRRQYEDELWMEFKSTRLFDPRSFEARPPWCIAGARNNSWASSGFLGDPLRESTWAIAGYLDRPFQFAYVWLDYAGFNGLLKQAKLPYIARRTAGELKKEARRHAKAVAKLSEELAGWPFRDVLNLGNLVRDSDYQNSITLPISAKQFTSEQKHIAVQVMLAGARQQVSIPFAGKYSLLDRAVSVLSDWNPPKSFIDRPNKPGAKPRYAARWLDHAFDRFGGAMPRSARLRLITELVQVLNELGEWEEDPWTEEQIRRCLDGKSKKRQ